MWTAHLFQTTSGLIGPQVDFASLSWSMELNGIESVSLSLRKSTLPLVDRNYWLAAWWAGVVLMWDGLPIVGGPIISRPSENIDNVSFTCGGIRSVLAHRTVTAEQTNWDLLGESIVSFSGLSLGTIAKKVVQQAQMKPAGMLPISFPIADQTAANDANHERTYKGFNLQNLKCDDVLTKLSNVLDGPDIMFKPRLIADNKLTFDMYYGTENHPRIKQRSVPVWDTTAAMGQVSDMTVNYTGTYQTSRVYSTGAGQDKKLLIKVNTNEKLLQQRYPLLESVINVGNSDKPALVNGYGLATLRANEEALIEIQMTVRGDGITPFGSFWPGDLAHVVTKGWLALPDGVTPMRILSVTGDDTANVKISLQKEDKFE